MSKNLQQRTIKKILQELAEWMLDESVSFTKLDSFRKRLHLDEEAFSKMLKISPSTYSSWRLKRCFPLHNRDQRHEVVLGVHPTAVGPQNHRLKGVGGGLQTQYYVVRTPSSTTPAVVSWKTSPHLFLAPNRLHIRHEKDNLKHLIKTQHSVGARKGEPCECSTCNPAKGK